LAACLQDPRQPGKITHRLDEILRFRMLAIVAGYPAGNDCDVLRGDPVFKMALDPVSAVLAALPHREHAAAPGALSHGPGDTRPIL
jgi:hypothetical protein